MQKVVYEYFDDSLKQNENSEVNKLLKEGWEIFDFAINEKGMVLYVLEFIEEYDESDEEYEDEDYTENDGYSNN